MKPTLDGRADNNWNHVEENHVMIVCRNRQMILRDMFSDLSKCNCLMKVVISRTLKALWLLFLTLSQSLTFLNWRLLYTTYITIFVEYHSNRMASYTIAKSTSLVSSPSKSTIIPSNIYIKSMKSMKYLSHFTGRNSQKKKRRKMKSTEGRAKKNIDNFCWHVIQSGSGMAFSGWPRCDGTSGLVVLYSFGCQWFDSVLFFDSLWPTSTNSLVPLPSPLSSTVSISICDRYETTRAHINVGTNRVPFAD